MEIISNIFSLVKCLIDFFDEKNKLDIWLVKMLVILL